MNIEPPVGLKVYIINQQVPPKELVKKDIELPLGLNGKYKSKYIGQLYKYLWGIGVDYLNT